MPGSGCSADEIWLTATWPFVREHLPEMPIVAFVGGRNAPPGKSLGHAGAIISGNFGTAQSKIEAFRAAGVPVAERPSEIPGLLAARLP